MRYFAPLFVLALTALLTLVLGIRQGALAAGVGLAGGLIATGLTVWVNEAVYALRAPKE